MTYKQIQEAKPADSPYSLYDNGTGLGLYLLVNPAGSKLWRIKFSVNGQRRLRGLGTFPEVGLQAARLAAAAMREDTEEAAAAQETPKLIFRQVASEWAARFLPGLALKTRQKSRNFLEEKILPFLGDLPLKEIGPPVVLNEVLRPIEARGNIETLHKVKTLLSQIFRYAVGIGVMERDFTLDLKGVFIPIRHVHRAAITDPGELGHLLRAIDSYQGAPVTGYALKILPYVFTRPGELRNAVWDEVSLDESLWRIPAARMKMRIAHVVPLASQVKTLFVELKDLTGGGPYLFPGRRSRTQSMSDMTLNAALRRLGYGGGEICGHGFRTTASTLLHEKGYPSEWIEAQLAHKDTNSVRAAYNRAGHLPDRIRMMQEWADYLDSLRAG
ncbi:MAG: tyrosine-type recombinase/integrase [Deltaproteobacteria bacterium]|nr:tyrosine-type recombinase/integrase [Deltaproteobacteria bacterium]